MLELEIPGRGQLQLSHLVLDLNGTLAKDGVVMPGVRERLRTLRGRFDIVIVTADTHGVADGLGAELNVTVHRLSPGAEAAQKRAYAGMLGAERCVAIGNGVNDVALLAAAAVGICVVGPEGAAGGAVTAADIVCGDILSALDLLAHPLRLVATLRS